MLVTMDSALTNFSSCASQNISFIYYPFFDSLTTNSLITNGVVDPGIARPRTSCRSKNFFDVMDYIFSWLPAIRYNPAEYIHKWSTPQLIVHGSKDYRLPETEGIAAFHALQQLVINVISLFAITPIWSFPRLGIPSRLVIFPDENHWVLDHGNRYAFIYLYEENYVTNPGVKI